MTVSSSTIVNPSRLFIRFHPVGFLDGHKAGPVPTRDDGATACVTTA
jgi:hypothetical protein